MPCSSFPAQLPSDPGSAQSQHAELCRAIVVCSSSSLCKVAELLYTSEEHGPVALCIMVEPGGEGEGEVENRDGLNFVYWATGGRRFLLIGAAPAKRIDALADTVAARFRS